jgi:hypothetical protein
VCEREEERERESARAGICMAISKRPGEPEGLDDSNAAFSCNLECLASQSRSPPPCGCGYDGCSLVGRGISTRPWNRAAAVAAEVAAAAAVVGELMSVVRCLVFCGRVESSRVSSRCWYPNAIFHLHREGRRRMLQMGTRTDPNGR